MALPNKRCVSIKTQVTLFNKMGEFAESLGKYISIICARLFAKWLEPYVDPYLSKLGQWVAPYESYIPGVLIALLAVWLIWAKSKERTPMIPEDFVSPIERSIHQKQYAKQSARFNDSSIMYKLGSASRRSLVAVRRILGSPWRGLINSSRRLCKCEGIEAPDKVRIPLAISLIALTGAVVTTWSYDFFILLRVVVFMTCAIAVTAIYKVNRSSSSLWALASIGVLYNPLLPIHLHRPTWGVLNCVVVLMFGLLYGVLKSIEASQKG